MKVLLIANSPRDASVVESLLGHKASDDLSWTRSIGRAEGIEGFHRDPADVVLLDLELGDADGFSSIAALQSHVGATPIIVLTSCDDDALAIKAMRHGVQDYLVKSDLTRLSLIRALRYALERSQTERRLSRQRQEQAALREISLAISSALNLWSVLQTLIEQVDALLPDLAVAIWIHDEESGRCEPFARWKLDEGDWRAVMNHFPLGLTDDACGSRSPWIVSNLPAATADAAAAAHSIHSIIAIPLLIEDRVLGLLSFIATRPRQTSDDEIEFLTALGAQAAIAVRNSRLHLRSLEQSFAVARFRSEIRESELKYAELLESLSAIVWEADLTTRRFSFVSRSVEAIVGVPATSLQQDYQSCLDLIHPEDRGRVLDLVSAQLSARADFEVEHRIIAADGRIVWLRQIVHLHKSPSGLPLRLRGIAIDTTASQNTQTVLMRRQQEIGALQEVAQKVVNADDVRSAIENILSIAMELGNYQAGSIHLADKNGALSELTERGYRSRVTFPLDEPTGPTMGSQGMGRLLKSVFDDRRPRVVADLGSPSELTSQGLDGILSAVMIPIASHHESLGVLFLGSRQARSIDTTQVALLEALAGHIGMVVQKARLYEQTKAQTEQLRRLANRLEAVREEERSQISREIHDQLGQELTVLKFDIAWLNGRVGAGEPMLSEKLHLVAGTLDRAIKTTREIATRLRPDILDRLGLTAAIEWQLQEFRKHTGVNYHFSAEPIQVRLNLFQSTALFRILQEALTNIARHSHATRARIKLKLQAGYAKLRIEDNGDGIDESRIFDFHSLGLLGMRERAAALGGGLTIQRNRNNGTTVTAQVPIGTRVQRP